MAPKTRKIIVPKINEQPIYHGKGRTTLSLIAEILSKSTQNYDQGEKFRFYRSLPTFKYLLIPQDYVSIMHYTSLKVIG